MFGQYANQWVNSTTPLRSLIHTNAKTLADVASQQKTLFCGLLDDSIHYLEQVSQQPELNTLVAAGHQLTSAARERLAKSSQASLHSLTELKNAYADTLGNTLTHLAHPELPTEVAAPQTEQQTVAKEVAAEPQAVATETAPVIAVETETVAAVETTDTTVTPSNTEVTAATGAAPAKKTTARARRNTKVTNSQKPE